MPHIHVQPNQHDITISAYIVLKENGTWKCLVHLHKKIDKLLQIGGHIELGETPWQTVAHEVREESGFGLQELQVLQHTADKMIPDGYVQHPVPFIMNTHNVGNQHFHSDLCYGFAASARPKGKVAAGESADLRWLTLDELDELAARGEALRDMVGIYHFLLAHLASYVQVPADSFSLEKPIVSAVVCKYGAPGSL